MSQLCPQAIRQFLCFKLLYQAAYITPLLCHDRGEGIALVKITGSLGYLVLDDLSKVNFNMKNENLFEIFFPLRQSKLGGNFFTIYFPKQRPHFWSSTDGATRIFLPLRAAAWFEPMVELHQTGTFEGRSTNWATAPRQAWWCLPSGRKAWLSVSLDHHRAWAQITNNTQCYLVPRWSNC